MGSFNLEEGLTLVDVIVNISTIPVDFSKGFREGEALNS
jgi:hypothetical protein